VWVPLQEVVSVLWTLVRLQPISHLKMEQHRALINKLAARYQALLGQQHQQIMAHPAHMRRAHAATAAAQRNWLLEKQVQDSNAAASQQDHQEQQQQQQHSRQQWHHRQQQQQQDDPHLRQQHDQFLFSALHQVPVFTHAAVLLAFARLQLPAARKLRPGACAAICKVGSQGDAQLLGNTASATGQAGCCTLSTASATGQLMTCMSLQHMVLLAHPIST
jgi:hypothetical protein